MEQVAVRKDGNPPGPMVGYRVLDLTDEKGYLAGKVLGDLGADVVKVEPPGGDPGRRRGPFYHDIADVEKSLSWFAYNTSKRSITLDITTADGTALFLRMAAEADFLIESFQPGYLDRLGLDYSKLGAINPRLIMCSITPFGQKGPCAGVEGPDLVVMAAGGLLILCGNEGLPPSRVVTPQSYLNGSAQAAAAMMIAHQCRATASLGQHIDLSLQEAVANTLLTSQQNWDIARYIERRGGKVRRGTVFGRLIWACKDGYVSWYWWVAPGWGRKNVPLIEWMQEEGIAGDLMSYDWEGLSTSDLTQELVDHWEALYSAFFERHTKAELYAGALQRRILLFPVNDAKALLENEQFKARAYFADVKHDELQASLKYPGPFFHSSTKAWGIRRRPPLVGEHNIEVYMGEMGLSRNDLAALKQVGAI